MWASYYKSLTWMFRPFWGDLGWGRSDMYIFPEKNNLKSWPRNLTCQVLPWKHHHIKAVVLVSKKEGTVNTVDGRNPKQPPGMYKTLSIRGYLPYQLVQDFWTINSIILIVCKILYRFTSDGWQKVPTIFSQMGFVQNGVHPMGSNP